MSALKYRRSTMSPIDLAESLAKSDSLRDQAEGVAIIVRGLTDDDGLRQGWPMTVVTIWRAAKYLGIPESTMTPAFVAEVAEIAPTLSDAILNR
jgi:hypothetical protein